MKLLQPFFPMRIGVDVDGVLADFVRPYCRELERRSGVQLPSNIDWDKWPSGWRFEGEYFPQDITREFWREARDWKSPAVVDQQERWWATLPVITTVVDNGILRLAHFTHELFFISNRPMHLRSTTQQWIEDNFDIVDTQVMHTKDKGALAKGLELHGLIDDKPDNLIEVARACGTSCVPVLIDRPWNKDFDNPYIHRATTLGRAFEYIERKVEQCTL